MVFFCVVTWAAAVAVADHGKPSAYIMAGAVFGAALACKYTAVFLVPLIVAAHLCSPGTPRSIRPFAPWRRWVLQGIAPLAIGAVVFLMLDPMVVLYHQKFRDDVSDQISDPLLGGSRPLWNANFRDVQPQLYWFTNLLPWGIGPAFAVWGARGRVLAADEKDAAGAGGGRLSPGVLCDCRADRHAVHPLLAAVDSGTCGRRRRPVRRICCVTRAGVASVSPPQHCLVVDGAVRGRVHEYL